MRPQFHFTDASGWINDPHGITFRDGLYEVFYQYVPGSVAWSPNCHWGHATGSDLLSLAPGPVALSPGDGDEGVWTGALVWNGSEARIFYTAVSQPDLGVGRVRVATPSDPGWQRWDKGAVVAEAPEGHNVEAFRDPFVLEEPDGSWRMFVGAALGSGDAAALTYRSIDMVSWSYEGVALQRSSAEREPVWMGSLWECPQIVALGDRHAMISSVWEADVLHYSAYATGHYGGGQFAAEKWGRMTYGPSYYAPSYFRDAEGRPCVTFWMRGVQDAAEGWAGAHSVPYLLGLGKDILLFTPHPDVASYRGELSPSGNVSGLAADVEWMPGRSLAITSSGIETAAISVEDASLTLRVGGSTWRMPFVGGVVRVIVDGPTLEVSSRYGLVGAPIAPQGMSLSVVSDSAAKVWPLLR